MMNDFFSKSTLAKAAISLITVLAPNAWGTPVYEVWNLHDYSGDLTSLEGWGMKVENFFGQGLYSFNFNNPAHALNAARLVNQPFAEQFLGDEDGVPVVEGARQFSHGGTIPERDSFQDLPL